MKLHFKCPVCAAHLNSQSMSSSGPCPSCQNNLEVEIYITAEEAALVADVPSRKVGNWRCSGKPHGTFDLPMRK